MSTDRNENIEELIAKSLAGETSVEEENQLADWLKKDSVNQNTYAQFKRAFEEGSKFYSSSPEIKAINLEKEWSQFVSSIDKQKDNQRTLVSDTPQSSSWLRIAAVLLLLVISGFVVNYFISQNKEIVFTTAENTLPVTLSDGTQVILNTNSQLSYSKSFGKETRPVKLQGEAFFEVAHDTTKPFIISAGATEIEVLGTSFNVTAYNEQKEVSVTVQTGKVKFSVPETKEEVKLEAGQRGEFTANKKLTSVANMDANFLFWKTRKLIFNENNLLSVIEAINKAYHAKIKIATTVPDTCVVTVTFDGQSLEAVLNVLKSTLNLTLQEKNGEIIITGAGC